MKWRHHRSSQLVITSNYEKADGPLEDVERNAAIERMLASKQSGRSQFGGESAMLKTSLCDVLGIDVSIILAPMGSASSAEFARTSGRV